MPLPLGLALFERDGGKRHEELYILDQSQADLSFDDFAQAPVLSINRNFSAPVIVETDRTPADLAFLSAHDDDPFARYEAMQQLMLDTLKAAIEGRAHDDAAVVAAVRATLEDSALDPAFVAEAVLLPSEQFIGDAMEVVDPDAVATARDALRLKLATELNDLWRERYTRHAAQHFEYSPAAKGARRMRNLALGYLAAGGSAEIGALAFAQFEAADNMTDRIAALGVLANGEFGERSDALTGFHDRYRHNQLVIDKWFTTQALSARADTAEQVVALLNHPDFTLNNPNRFRSLVGAFSVNQRAFHRADGAGYALLAEQIAALDAINPQTAAKMVPALGRWKRFDEARQLKMKAALEQILATPNLSKDVFEQASKSLSS
jgi:aminopeptidase N